MRVRVRVRARPRARAWARVRVRVRRRVRTASCRACTAASWIAASLGSNDAAIRLARAPPGTLSTARVSLRMAILLAISSSLDWRHRSFIASVASAETHITCAVCMHTHTHTCVCVCVCVCVHMCVRVRVCHPDGPGLASATGWGGVGAGAGAKAKRVVRAGLRGLGFEGRPPGGPAPVAAASVVRRGGEAWGAQMRSTRWSGREGREGNDQGSPTPKPNPKPELKPKPNPKPKPSP